MKAHQLKSEKISKRRIDSYWLKDELSEFLRSQWREKKENSTRVIGVRARDFLERFYSEGSSLMRNSDWRSEISGFLMDSLSRTGFSTNSAIENRQKPVRIDKIRGEWIVKIELFPEIRR